MDFKYFSSLAEEVTPPPDGILSRTLHDDDRLKVVLFGFSQGQQLSEHTAAVPAVLHLLEGEAVLRLGREERQAQAGAWVYMAPKLPHGILAKTPLILLLMMLKRTAATAP